MKSDMNTAHVDLFCRLIKVNFGYFQYPLLPKPHQNPICFKKINHNNILFFLINVAKPMTDEFYYLVDKDILDV